MKRRRDYVALFGITALTAVINVAAWSSTAFCDYYVLHIYPFIVDTYGRITGRVPFSVGEAMIGTGLLLTAAVLLTGLAAVIFLLTGKRAARYGRCRKACRCFHTAYAWLLAGIFVIMTLNCFIPYHCSPLEARYALTGGTGAEAGNTQDIYGMWDDTYTLEELAMIRDFIVIKANELARRVERDEDGNIIFPENMDELAAESMRRLSADCEQLDGYYPRAKEIACSGFLSQQSMKGYFFPFSMEANFNNMMHPVNRPATICHEYAHLKGFMFEDEANLIGFLACIHSPDPVFQYSGYLSVLNYVNNEYYEAIGRNEDIYASRVKISPQVRAENVFLQKEAWKRVEQKAVFQTETVNKVSDRLSETSMVLNGVQDGIRSYTRVVGLLISYYRDSPELAQSLAGPEYLAQSQ